MNGKRILLIGALLLASASLHAAPLGTAISYQGRLEDNGAPANGTYSFRFRLLADASGTTPIGPEINLPSQAITGGLLFATLDFGAGAFDSDARWLEIFVKTGGPDAPNTYTRLNPQPLLPGGSSQFARTAGDVLNGSITGAKIASGQVVKGLSVGPNLLRDDVTLVAGNNIVLTPSGNTITIASLGGGGSSPWQALNNSVYFNGGHVGIGTMAPTVPLHIESSATASSVLAALLEPNLANNGFNQIYLGRTPAGNGCSTFTYTYDAANPSLSRLSLGLYDSSFSLNVLGNGNVGIGTTTPTALLHVNSTATVSSVLAAMLEPNLSNGGFNQIYLGRSPVANACGTLTYSYNAVSPNLSSLSLGLYDNSYVFNILGNGHVTFAATDLLLGHSTRRGSPGRALVDGGNALHLNFNGDWANTVIGGNNVSVGTLTIRGGADLAEPFPMKEETIEKGSVVVIDDEHPGRLKRSTQAYDTRVAGIVSGANGINPGIALKQEGVLDQGENVALTGRVYVQADASHGAIKPGDLLTTSDTPGHAMKVADSVKAQGAILGKAMSALQDGTGLVLVLVTLQ